MELNPNDVVEHRTDIEAEFNEPFLESDEQLLPLISEGEERVVLDFTGVNVVTNSFADECIAKLLLKMPLAELKKRTTFRGLNPLAEKSVLVALQRRYSVLKASNNEL